LLSKQSKDIDQASLKDNITWSIFGQKRGAEEEEIISAELKDDLTKAADGNEDEDLDEEDNEEVVSKQDRVVIDNQVFNFETR
jgi:hypothetical protein